MQEIVVAAEQLIAAVTTDEHASGGLLSRETIRQAEQLRILLAQWKRGAGSGRF